MSEKHQCCAPVWSGGSYRSHQCGKGAAHEYEGSWYCKTHHPPTLAAKRDARYAKWKEEREANRLQAEAAQAATAEQKRKAYAYDELVEMNAELVDALKDCANVCAGENTTKSGLVRALEKARAALTKASASSISKGVE